ncbi:hypothetical protein ACFL6X_09850, partial [Candidatus Latescibacterota bacterium]
IEVRGDLGTEAGGSNTRICAPAEASSSRTAQRAAILVGRHRAEVEELQQRLDDLERRAQKRAKADGYWSKLLEGERPKPSGPLQARALSQFADYSEQKRKLDRQIAANQQAVKRLAQEAKGEEAEGEGAPEITVAVGGTLYMDVAFEAGRPIGEEDEVLAVSFSLEGERLTGRTLADVRGLLVRQVGAYREEQQGHVEERRKALEELHKGRSKKPEGPQMEDRTFSLPITWDEAREGEEGLTITTEVWVRALEPDKVVVRSSARVKAPMQNVDVSVGGEGARATYTVTAQKELSGWQQDEEVTEALEQVVAKGTPATDVLAGTAVILPG